MANKPLFLNNPEAQELLQLMEDNPEQAEHALNFSDWLEKNGYWAHAEAVRGDKNPGGLETKDRYHIRKRYENEPHGLGVTIAIPVGNGSRTFSIKSRSPQSRDFLYDALHHETGLKQNPISKLRDEDTGRLPAYSWSSGGLPLVYFTRDNGILCPDCANGENGSDATEHSNDPQWRLTDHNVREDGPPIQCGHCNAEIESFYGDPDAPPSD